MDLIVYGDFNCPYSFLASQRVDTLARLGAAGTQWRAVEHDPDLPVSGLATSGRAEQWERELAEVATLALPGEHPPAAAPPLLSNTAAAVAAYAEAVTDGVQDELRRVLFADIWDHQQHLSSAYEVRERVTGLVYPTTPPDRRLSTPDLPGRLDRNPDPAVLARKAGGTVAPDGTPLTSAGHERVRQWREEWLAASGGTVPALVTGDGAMVTGVDALARLAELLPAEAGGRPAGAGGRPAEGAGRS